MLCCFNDAVIRSGRRLSPGVSVLAQRLDVNADLYIPATTAQPSRGAEVSYWCADETKQMLIGYDGPTTTRQGIGLKCIV